MADVSKFHWQMRMMGLAELVAVWSKDPKRGVGAVIVSSDTRQVCWGFNGFPVGIADRPLRLSVDETKLQTTVHAELNAIINARRDLSGWHLFVTDFPCHECAKAIIQAGIARVVVPHPPRPDSKWHRSHQVALSLLHEAQVDLTVLCDGH